MVVDDGFMQIHVNGQLRTTKDGATVADLLREIEIRPDRVAVELNLQVLERQEFESRGLCEGDRVEIINFIGGGRGCGQPTEDRFHLSLPKADS